MMVAILILLPRLTTSPPHPQLLELHSLHFHFHVYENHAIGPSGSGNLLSYNQKKNKTKVIPIMLTNNKNIFYVLSGYCVPDTAKCFRGSSSFSLLSSPQYRLY